MPIGKNIKKDTIIPAAGKKKVKATKAVKKKKTVQKQTAANVETIAEQVEEQTIESLEVSQIEPAVQAHKVSGGRYITEREFQERQRLKSKFDEEIKGYQDRDLQLVTFPIANERYAVDIDAIKEVVPTPHVSKIPHAPDYIKGVSNIRGTVMVILNLASKFDLATKEQTEKLSDYTMVIKGANFMAGVLLDQVPTTLKVSGKNIVSSAGLLSNTALDETFIKGLIKTDGDMVIYLDISELVEDDDVRVMTQALDHLK